MSTLSVLFAHILLFVLLCVYILRKRGNRTHLMRRSVRIIEAFFFRFEITHRPLKLFQFLGAKIVTGT